jgi:hypothetical protein
MHLHPRLGEEADAGLELRDRRGVEHHVSLHPHAVDRHPAFPEVADERRHELRLPGVVHVVVVVEEARRGVDLVRPVKPPLQEIRAQDLHPGAPAPSLVLVDRLVDHVPGGDFPFVAPDQGADVLFHLPEQVVARDPSPAGGRLEQVARRLRMPHEGVTQDIHAVPGREADQPVGEFPLPAPGFGVYLPPLHAVLGRDGAELARDQVQHAAVLGLEGAVADGGTDQKVPPVEVPEAGGAERFGQCAFFREGGQRQGGHRLRAETAA